MERQHGYGGGEADALGARRYAREHEVGAGEHAEGTEMMLPDPGGMEAHLLGVNRLIEDVGHELVGAPMVVFVVVVAQREIAEIHLLSAPSQLTVWHGGMGST